MRSGNYRSGTGGDLFVGMSTCGLAAVAVIATGVVASGAPDPGDATAKQSVTYCRADASQGDPLPATVRLDPLCYWDDLPDRGNMTADFAERGYIVEFAPRVSREARQMRQQLATAENASRVATAPLPAAVFMFPLGAGLAVYMGRKLR